MDRPLLHKANVVGYGTGLRVRNGRLTDEVVTSVMVREKLPLAYIRREDIIPSEAFGRLTDVVETGEIIALGANTGRVRPVVPGYSIGHHAVTAGTLGAIVNGAPGDLLLSNHHVLAAGGDIGDAILQPGKWDGGTETVARLHEYVDIHAYGATCPVALAVERLANRLARWVRSSHRIRAYSDTDAVANRVDAAVALPEPGIGLQPAIADIGGPGLPVEAALGLPVHKSGRTTGYTQGTISQVDATVRVQYPMGYALFDKQVVVRGQELSATADDVCIERFSAPGDSGSLVLNGLRPTGLLFAGSDVVTIANPIQDVLDALAVWF